MRFDPVQSVGPWQKVAHDPAIALVNKIAGLLDVIEEMPCQCRWQSKTTAFRRCLRCRTLLEHGR